MQLPTSLRQTIAVIYALQLFTAANLLHAGDSPENNINEIRREVEILRSNYKSVIEWADFGGDPDHHTEVMNSYPKFDKLLRQAEKSLIKLEQKTTQNRSFSKEDVDWL